MFSVYVCIGINQSAKKFQLDMKHEQREVTITLALNSSVAGRSDLLQDEYRPRYEHDNVSSRPFWNLRRGTDRNQLNRVVWSSTVIKCERPINWRCDNSNIRWSFILASSQRIISIVLQASIFSSSWCSMGTFHWKKIWGVKMCFLSFWCNELHAMSESISHYIYRTGSVFDSV